MTTAVTLLSMQKYVPLPRAYCSENFLIISKFFEVAVNVAFKNGNQSIIVSQSVVS